MEVPIINRAEQKLRQTINLFLIVYIALVLSYTSPEEQLSIVGISMREEAVLRFQEQEDGHSVLEEARTNAQH